MYYLIIQTNDNKPKMKEFNSYEELKKDMNLEDMKKFTKEYLPYIIIIICVLHVISIMDIIINYKN